MLDGRKKEMLINMLKDPERKNLVRITYEFSRCSILKRELAGHYFTRLLYKKGICNYMDYITNKEMQAIRYRDKDACQQSLAAILDNKILFHKHFSRFDLRLPFTLGWNVNGQVTIGKNLYQVENQDDFGNLLAVAMREQNLSGVFVKPAEGSFGHGCSFLSLKDVEEGLNCYPGLLEGSFLYQQPVVQHEVLRGVFPFCLNTLRLDTFIDTSGKPKLITSYIRFGVNQNHVDNARMGGCFVAVDIETGALREKAYNTLEYGGSTLYRHPTTQAAFKGITIPYFNETKAMALEAARLLPFRLTGWDIGITPEGPILMEGNSAYHLDGSDMAFGGFRKHPVYQEIIKEFLGQ